MDAAHKAGCTHCMTRSNDGVEGIYQRFGWDMKEPSLIAELDPDGPPPSLLTTGEFYFD
jgi:hypothetical protein